MYLKFLFSVIFLSFFPVFLTNAGYPQQNSLGNKISSKVGESAAAADSTTSSMLQLRKSVENIITTTTPTEDDIAFARKILALYFSLEKNVISKDVIKELNKSIATRPIFTELIAPIKNAYKISNSQKFIDYIGLCPSLKEDATSAQDYHKVFTSHIERVCYDHLFKSALTIIKKEKFSSPEVITLLQFIQNNFSTIVNSNNTTTFISFLGSIRKGSESYFKLSDIASNFYIKEKIRPPSKILQKIHINSDLTSFIQHYPADDFSNVMVREYKEDITQLMDEIRRKRKNSSVELNHEEYEKKIEAIITYYLHNKANLPNYKVYPYTLLLGRFLLNQKLYVLSERVFRFSNSIATFDKFYESVYYIFWNKVVQEKHDDALDVINEFKVKDNLGRASVKMIFWLAYTLSRKGDQDEAKKLYKKIIDQSPLNYHSVMASKLLPTIMSEEEKKSLSTSAVSDEFSKHLLSERLNSKHISSNISFSQIPQNIKTRIKRIQIWSKLNNNYFTNLEATSFVNLNELIALNINNKDSSASASTSSLEEKQKINKDYHSQILILISVLSELGYYNQSFNILNSAIEKGFVKSDKLSLQVLFPTPYLKEIELLDSSIDPILILSLIRQESAFNPHAVSSAGARGLMQLMPKTARHTARKNLSHSQLGDPVTNMKIGITYLKKLINRYNGNLIYALAAYNAGERNTQKWIDHVFTSNSTNSILYTVEMIPFTETQIYVQSIFRNIYFYKLVHEEMKQDSPSIDKFFDIVLRP
ncbi:MAG: lytic transglycosylase domain-containing protein [Oligoflexia bacterium]|nr:lytic transglycosylase domain-containing protein [Oligoflexia bacterium]